LTQISTWIVFSDFDGTVTTRDTCDAVLSAFAPDTWRELDEQFHEGLMSGRECIVRQFEGVRATTEQVQEFLRANLSIDSMFPEFIRRLEAAGVPVCVVSDGFELSARTLLEASDLGHLPLVSNRIEFSPEGARVSFPNSREECISGGGNCKCLQVETRRGDRKVMLVGDGYSDRCVSRLADLVFAKGVLQKHCEEHAIPHVAYGDFGDVLASPELAAVLGSQASE